VTTAERWRELRTWKAENTGNPADPDLFEREILPAIQHVPLRELMWATGLSLPYVSQIRRGEKVPHLRHWPALREAGSSASPEVSGSSGSGLPRLRTEVTDRPAI
jgi:hypothetical protein